MQYRNKKKYSNKNIIKTMKRRMHNKNENVEYRNEKVVFINQKVKEKENKS